MGTTRPVAELATYWEATAAALKRTIESSIGRDPDAIVMHNMEREAAARETAEVLRSMCAETPAAAAPRGAGAGVVEFETRDGRAVAFSADWITAVVDGGFGRTYVDTRATTAEGETSSYSTDEPAADIRARWYRALGREPEGQTEETPATDGSALLALATALARNAERIYDRLDEYDEVTEPLLEEFESLNSQLRALQPGAASADAEETSS